MKSLLLMFICVLGGAAANSPAAVDEGTQLIVTLNAELLEVAQAEDALLTLKGVRALAMMHLAMAEVISESPGDDLADAASAAYLIASRQYPEAEARFAAIAMRYGFTPGASDASRGSGGLQVAERHLAARAKDGYDNAPEYQWHPMAPGVYAEFAEHSDTPQGFIFGAGWGTAKPFALPRADFFRAPPPPAIDSDEYTAAFNEVKALGRADSPQRSADQTHLALWWKDFAERSHNRLARQLAVEQRLEAGDTALLFARLNVAIFDAYVNVFENKFYYNHWRPYTAIRWADNDGNPDTEAESDWDNTHHHTYAFPSYPSAHGTACAAAMMAMEATLGRGFPFIMTTEFVDSAGPGSPPLQMHPPTRSFASFDEAAMECAMSRLYLGIHFRYDSIEGYHLGRRIGRYVVSVVE